MTDYLTRHRLTRTILLLLSLFIVQGGCIVNPVYQPEDLRAVAGIDGLWEPADDESTSLFNYWTISPADSNRYFIRHGDGHGDQYYIAGFLKLKGTLYADVADIEFYGSGKYTVTGTHSILKIYLRGDTLRAVLIDGDYLTRCIKSRKYNLEHTVHVDRSSDYNTGSTIFITAATAQLQAFLIANSRDTLLFPEQNDIVFHRGDTTFNRYFPKEAWDFEALKRRPDVPAVLKDAFTYNARRKDLTGMIDSLAGADDLYKPFYFRLASLAGLDDRRKPDSATASQYVSYVLNHTRDFLHFFNGGNYGSETTLLLWAGLVRRSSAQSGTLDAALARLKTASTGFTAKERQILHVFLQSIRPDREAYVAAFKRFMGNQEDSPAISDVEATAMTVSAAGDPVQLVFPACDSVYLLTGSGHWDSLLARIVQTTILEPDEPAPVKEQLQLDPRSMKAYALYIGQLYPLRSFDGFLVRGTGTPDPEAWGRSKPVVTHWTVREAAPLCYAFHYTPGEPAAPFQLINYCADKAKVLAVLKSYVPTTFRRFIRHFCIPVSYVARDGSCYAVVHPKRLIREGEQPLAHVAAFRKGMVRVYRVWMPGGNPNSAMLNCFVQDGYCYLYDRWNGGSGGKDARLYGFALLD